MDSMQPTIFFSLLTIEKKFNISFYGIAIEFLFFTKCKSAVLENQILLRIW